MNEVIPLNICLRFLFFSIVVGNCGIGQAQFSETEIEFFEARIRPLFIEQCGECHSEKQGVVEANLNLDHRQSILQGGDSGPAVVPKEVDESLLIDAINYRGLYEMPPSSKLSAEQIKTVEQWVAMGAPWPEHDSSSIRPKQRHEFNIEQRRQSHWCWRPVIRQNVPMVKDVNWCQDPIDHFVCARHESNGLHPAKRAERRTWIRRVYFDLVGLLPEPVAIRSYLDDSSPTANERVVDQLLASPRFGERWARHWMDLMRFAETYGHEFDFPIRNAYEYRDYLIRAFNADVPYDQLIKEHIAGDLLEDPRLNPNGKFNESIIGTGFWFLGEQTHGPVDVKADEAGRIDNQIDVMCKSFLGLTVACARCHDHKFDAISDEDYYALSGYLQSSRRQLAMLDPGAKIESTFFQASIAVDKLDRRLRESVEEVNSLSATELSARLKEWINTESQGDSSVEEIRNLCQIDNSNQFNEEAKKLARKFEKISETEKNLFDRSKLFADFSKGIPENWFQTGYAFRNTLSDLGYTHFGSRVRMAGLDSGRHGTGFCGVVRSPTFEIQSDKILVLARGNQCLVRLIIDGYEMGQFNPLLFKGCQVNVDNDTFQWIELAEDVKNYHGHRAYLEFIDHGDGAIEIDQVRFSNEQVSPPRIVAGDILPSCLKEEVHNQDELLDSLAREISRRLNAGLVSHELCAWLNRIVIDETFAQHHANELTILNRENATVPQPRFVVAMTDGSPEDEHLFIRGNAHALGPSIKRRFLTAIRDENDDFDWSSGSGRLHLAEKIASADNPLTSRVFVNRIWHHLIGRGLVKSTDNFGVLGESPTHPKLLDYLASEFVDSGWSTKKMIRRIVLSETYSMSNQNPQTQALDNDNIWISRANTKRMQGEVLRDSILQLSSNLDPSMYGQSIPAHLNEFMQGRGRPKKSGPLDGGGRRSIYLEVRRNFLNPMMLAFDTPIPFNSIGNRHRSNVPAQALILMNDPFVINQAQKWAQQIVSAKRNREDNIRTIFESALGRLPKDEEMTSALEFLNQQLEERNLLENGADQEILVWADFCHAIFNLKEFIFIK